ncbi:MAG: sigma-54 dependent transcriptional regulator [Pseudomonadota bacterium]
MTGILIIDDNETVREGVAAISRKLKHKVYTAASGGEGVGLFKRHQPDFVITDLKMEGVGGIEVLQQIRDQDPDAVVMIMTGYGTVEAAVEAMKRGAFDFIQKPFPPEVVRLKIEAALSLRLARRERERMQQAAETFSRDLAAPFSPEGIVGSSEVMKEVLRIVEKVARADTTVFIRGDSGTGKELIARAIHDGSERRARPFVTVSCAALAESLLESELFGHEKGSFTGAVKRKLGRFELADGGTLFLDEIGDVPMSVQTKLLRVLQERTFERVGGEEPVHVDVRVISATHRDIGEMVRQGSFREDLYYRLHIVPIELPPLRDRPSDLETLARHFVAKLGPRTNPLVKDIAPEAVVALRAYRWPGNVRELENAIEQSLVFAEGQVLQAHDLPAFLTGVHRPSPASAPLAQLDDDDRPLDEILETLEKSLILRAFKKARGVKTETARLLGIKTSALYYKLDKYSIGEADGHEA